jgi:hypothetical protein
VLVVSLDRPEQGIATPMHRRLRESRTARPGKIGAPAGFLADPHPPMPDLSATHQEASWNGFGVYALPAGSLTRGMEAP